MKLTKDQEEELFSMYWKLEEVITQLSRLKYQLDEFFDRYRDKEGEK